MRIDGGMAIAQSYSDIGFLLSTELLVFWQDLLDGICKSMN